MMVEVSHGVLLADLTAVLQKEYSFQVQFVCWSAEDGACAVLVVCQLVY